VLATVQKRRDAEDRARLAVVEWQTRALASFIASTAFTDKKGHEKLLAEVDKLQLLPREKESPSPTKEPQAGSYERFMGAFGRELSG
jgi:hypothetical protein